MTFTKERLTELSRRENVGAILGEEIAELARIALASLEAEPVCVIDQSNLDYLNSGSDADVWPASRTEMGDVLLYRAAPPAPVSVPDRSMFEKWWESEHGSPLDSWDSLRTTDGYCDDGIDGQFEAWNACRAAMLQGAPVRSSMPDGVVTAEHRRVIEMLLNVCGAAFELADDSCQQDVDGEECHVVPEDAFQKLSDALDEIENTLPTEDVDRPDVFLAWSAMPRAALKSLLQAGNSPVIPDGWISCSDRMPDEDDWIMAFHIDGYQRIAKWTSTSGHYHMRNFTHCWEYDGNDSEHEGSITHWMPLPAAPQQEVKP